MEHCYLFCCSVIAYENVGPVEAVKRSAEIMKDKWGERIGAGFSFGLIAFAAIIVFAIISIAIGTFVNEQAGIALFVTGMLAIGIVMSALNSIFISAVYNSIRGNTNEHFNNELIDRLFVEK